MTRCLTDACVYHCHIDGGDGIVFTFVDDIGTITSDPKMRKKVRAIVQKEFEVRYLGPMSYMLGIEFQRHPDGSMTLNQSKYIQQILTQFGMQWSKPVGMPGDPSIKLTGTQHETNEEEIPLDTKRFPYRQLIGCLMYLSCATRPDISYMTNLLGQFCSQPQERHWKAAKRVLSYLSGTRDWKIVYRPSGKPLTAYSDADWATALDDRRSTSGCLVILAGGPIAWKARKQTAVALSSMEAEYAALAETTRI